MKQTFLFLFILANSVLFSSVVMKRIDTDLFINGCKQNLEKIYTQNEYQKKAILKQLFEKNLLEHQGTKLYDVNANFEIFYLKNGQNFNLIDLDKDGIDELIFQGFVDDLQEKEFTEIYVSNNHVYSLKYREVGTLIAYKIQPNTKEIVLFQHQYPCCSNISHNLYTLRLIDHDFKIKSKYFLARDGIMKGNFFPEKCNLKAKYKLLKKETLLYWSDEKIPSNASLLSETNEIIHYPKNSLYRVIAKKGNWKYAIFYGIPKLEKSRVVKAENLSEMHFFAWFQE